MIENTVSENRLTSVNKIDITKLKTNQYTISLLNEAYRVGLVENNTLSRIRFQITDILKELILQYTKGASTSVRVEIAESLLCSIFYAMDLFLLKGCTPEEAILNLQTNSIEDLYRKGLEEIEICFNETKKLYYSIIRNRLHVENEAYNLTLTREIPIFIENYNMLFEAHISKASIDYPLVFDDMSIQGILYMKNYLTNLKIETDFCRLFNLEDINRLLHNFGKTIGMDHRVELLSLFELVFNNAVFSIISGSKILKVILTERELNTVTYKLSLFNPTEIDSTINSAVVILINRLGISDTGIVQYIDRYKGEFIKRVIRLVKDSTLNSIVIVEQGERSNAYLSFKEGERMKDDKFNALMRNLADIPETEDKIKLLMEEVKCLHDFLDILESDCFFGEEYEKVYESLGEADLSVLARIVFYEDTREVSFRLPSVILKYKGAESEWQEGLSSYLGKLSADKLISIEEKMRLIDYEEISFY